LTIIGTYFNFSKLKQKKIGIFLIIIYTFKFKFLYSSFFFQKKTVAGSFSPLGLSSGSYSPLDSAGATL
jgi:hypothetical protein